MMGKLGYHGYTFLSYDGAVINVLVSMVTATVQ